MDDSIEKRFDYNDPTVYAWIICGSTRSIPLFLVSVVAVTIGIPAVGFFWAAVAYLPIAFLTSIAFGGRPERVFPVLFLWLPIVVMAVYPVWVLYLLRLSSSGERKKKNLQAKSNLQELTCTAIGVIACLVCGPLSTGFAGNTHSVKQYCFFFLDCGLRAILLDLPDAFDFRLSDIHPALWYARTATVLIIFSIAAGLVGFFWGVGRRRFGKMLFHGTVQKCLWKCQNLLDRDTLKLRREARVEPLSNDRTVEALQSFTHPETFVKVVAFVEALAQQDYEWCSKHKDC